MAVLHSDQTFVGLAAHAYQQVYSLANAERCCKECALSGARCHAWVFLRPAKGKETKCFLVDINALPLMNMTASVGLAGVVG